MLRAGERAEDAIHPFALHLAIHVHTGGLVGIIHLGLSQPGFCKRGVVFLFSVKVRRTGSLE